MTNSSNLFTIQEIEEKFGSDVATAVRIERGKTGSGRSVYRAIFTKPVCEMLYRKHLHPAAPHPMTVTELAEANPFVAVGNIDTLKRYLLKHNAMSPADATGNRPAPPTLAVSPEQSAEVTAAVDLAAPEEDETATAVVENPSFQKYADDRLESFAAAMRNISLPPGLSFEPSLHDFPALHEQLETVLNRLNQIPGVTATGSIDFSWNSTTEEANDAS